MTLATFMFYFFIVLAAGSALAMLFIRQVFHAALLLIVTLLAVAGLYVLAFAEFIAVAQILVYAGGVLVIIIFGIMLTSKISGKPLVVENNSWFGALLVGTFFFAVLIKLFSQEVFPSGDVVQSPGDNSMQAIGILLMSNFILPFEIAGILLLVALIGAAVTASSSKLKN